MDEQEILASSTLMPSLRVAYSNFKSGNFQVVINLLRELIDKNPEAKQPGVASSAVWAMLGDSYFIFNDPESGFTAYRKSIELDEGSGCLSVFASQVVKCHRVRDASFALACLRASSRANRRAITKFPLHFLSRTINYQCLKHLWI